MRVSFFYLYNHKGFSFPLSKQVGTTCMANGISWGANSETMRPYCIHNYIKLQSVLAELKSIYDLYLNGSYVILDLALLTITSSLL